MSGFVEYICEWCEYSDLPGIHPEICKIKICPKHGRCWFWPKETEPSDTQTISKEGK